MIHHAIKARKSTVLFDPQPISEDELNTLFEAARWAPSSRNAQPWRFIYSRRGEDFYKTMYDCLIDSNRQWAGNAPILLATVAQTVSEYKQRPNKYAWHDTAMAYSNIVFQATTMGLSLHPMGGFDREKATKVLEIVPPFEIVAMAALGRKSESSDFPENLIERENSERKRKPLSDLVFHGKLHNPHNLQGGRGVD